MRSIVVASGKGGVGKTTVAVNLAIALAQAGKKTVIFDADLPMADVGIFLGQESAPITLHDVLMGEVPLKDAIYEGPAGVMFVPSSLSLESYRAVDARKLAAAVGELEAFAEYVIVDSPPGLNKDVAAALACAEESLIVLTPDPPSLTDALKMKILAQKSKANPIGIVVNMVRGEKGEVSRKDIEAVMDLQVLAMIPEDPEVRRSALQQKPFMVRSPNCPASQAIRALAAQIMGEAGPAPEVPARRGFFARLFGFLKR